MRDFITRLFACMLALAVITTGGLAFAGSAAADVTTDGDIQADSTQSNYDASDNNRTITYETGNNTDTLDDFDELSLDLDSADGHDLAEYDIEDAEITAGGSDDTTPITVEWTVNDEDVEELAGDANSTSTVDYAIDELQTGEEGALTDEGSYEYEFTAGHAAALVTDNSTETEDLEASTINSFSMGYFGQDEDTLYTHEDTVGIEGNETTVSVFDTSEGADAIDERISDEEYEDGDLITEVAVGDGDVPLPAFYGEAGDAVDEDEDTYAVYHDNGEWTFNLGSEDYEGESEFDFVIESQSYTDADYEKSDMGGLFIEDLEVSAFDTFGYLDAFSTFSWGDLFGL